MLDNIYYTVKELMGGKQNLWHLLAHPNKIRKTKMQQTRQWWQNFKVLVIEAHLAPVVRISLLQKVTKGLP
jgi:hypothetical protein